MKNGRFKVYIILVKKIKCPTGRTHSR